MQTAEEKAAQSLFDSQKYKESQTHYQKILESSPNNILALVYLSRCLQETDPSSPQISKLLKQALTLDKSNPYTLFTMGCYYFKRHTFNPAIKYFTETLKIEKDHLIAAFNLGVCYDSLGDHHKSIEFYTLCLKIDPDHVKSLANKAIALDKIGKSEESRVLFEKVLTFEETALIYNNFAVCHKNLQNSHLALKYFQKACELDPTYSIAHYNLAVHLTENNEIEKAVEHFHQAIKLDKSHVFACLALGNLLENKEKFYFALKIFECIYGELPKIPGVLEKIQVIKQRLGDIEKISSPRKAFKDISAFLQWNEEECFDYLEDEKTSLYANLRLGVIFCTKGEYSKAKKHLNQVAVIDSNFHSEIVNERLGEVYFKKDKDFDRAKEAFLKAAQKVNSADMWIRCGKCCEKVKDYQGACEFYEKAIYVDPKSIPGHFRYGWSLVKLGNKDLGLEKLENAYKLDPVNPRILMKYAEVLVRDGIYLEKALNFLQTALKLDPDNGEILIILAKCQEKLGKPEETLKTLEKAAEMPKVKISALYNLGSIYENTDKQRAISAYEQCLILDKSNLPTLIRLATLLANIGDIPKAKKYFREAIQLDAENITAHFSLGKIYQATSEDYEDAIRHYEIVISLDQSHYKACCQLGILYMDKGELKKALEYLLQSIEINNKYTLSHVSIGNLYFERKNMKECIKHFKEALKLTPKEVQALVGLGNSYFQLKKPGEAIKYYKKALNIEPDLAETHFNLGNAYYLKQEIDHAIECYKKAIEISPNKPESHYNLANAYTIKCLYNEAIGEFKVSLKLNNQNPDALYNMANAYYLLNEFNEAVRNYKEAINLGMNTPEGFFNLALAYYKLDKFDSCLEQLRFSYELEPNNHEITYYLALTLTKLNNILEAKNYLTRCLEIKPDYDVAKELLQKIS